MSKLPAAARAKLSSALASGKLPDFDDESYNDVYDIFGDLWNALGDEWSQPDASPARRHVAALVELWSTIPSDGLTVGVGVNQPELPAAAVQAAAELKLPKVLALLKRIQKHIPAEVASIDDVEQRLTWYQSDKGEDHAAALEELEQECQDGEFGEELMLGALRRVLAEPAEYFASR